MTNKNHGSILISNQSASFSYLTHAHAKMCSLYKGEKIIRERKNHQKLKIACN
jgi:hypothetical protein